MAHGFTRALDGGHQDFALATIIGAVIPVPKIKAESVVFMELGGIMAVSVIPAGADQIVRLSIAAVTGHGMGIFVNVITVGAVMIALKIKEMLAEHMGHGITIVYTKAVFAIPVMEDLIVLKGNVKFV